MKIDGITHITALLFTGMLFQGGDACAQTVDYGSFQSLFGEPITTSATGNPQRVSEVPANMTIITADEIRQSGSRSIPEILSHVPGLDILRTSVNMYDVGVRGYQQPFQPRLLVLIDGQKVFNDDYSRTEWNNLPVNIDDIRQIEVVKGAASALFGSNAVGGVVNIITYNPLYDSTKTANLSGGTQQTVFGDATFTQHFGDWAGVKISAGGMSGADFNTPKPQVDGNYNNRPAHQYIAENSVFNINQALQARLQMTYSNSKEEGAELGYGIQNSVDTVYSLRAGFSWQTPYGLITNDNYYNHDYELAYFVIIPGIDSTTDLFTSKLEDQFRIGSDNTFRFGIEYRQKAIWQSVPNNIDNPQNAEVDDSVYTVGGTWLWQINDKLSWTNSARVDHSALSEGGTIDPNFAVQNYNNSINTFSANSGLVYHATALDAFRATYGRGVQLPSMIQNGVAIAVPISGIVADIEGNPLLKPTIVENYELGYDRGLPDIMSTARFSLYYEINKDVAAYPVTVGTRFINGTPWILEQAENVGNSHGFGGEVELKGNNPQGFRWDASYSLSTVADAATVANTLGYEKSAPESHFRLLLGYTTGKWEFDTNGQWVTSTDMLRNLNGISPVHVSTAGYTSLSARIGYNVTDDFILSLSGTNLTRADTQENPYPAIQRQVFLGLTGKF